MPIPKKVKRDQEIKLYLTLSQKNQLKKRANSAKKSLSEYILQSASSTIIDTGEIDFYQNINDDLIFLKRSQQAVIYSLIFLMNKQLNSNEDANELFEKFIKDAEKKIRKNDC